MSTPCAELKGTALFSKAAQRTYVPDTAPLVSVTRGTQRAAHNDIDLAMTSSSYKPTLMESNFLVYNRPPEHLTQCP